MNTLVRFILAVVVAAASLTPLAAAAEPRIALVLGNAAYARGPIRNSLADAALVAEALNSIGFQIVEGADLDQAELRRVFREFLARLEEAGPDAIAFVYFSGYGLEYEGENYLIPVDARLARDSDVPLEAVRLSDLIRSLEASPVRAKVLALDAARPLPVTIDVAPGFAAVDAPPGMLVAFSSAPGTFAEDNEGAYGAYASAIAEMIREPRFDLHTVFTGVRIRTHDLTGGRQTPWHIASLAGDVVLVPDDAGDAPQAAWQPPPAEPQLQQPLSELGPDEAYRQAIAADTLPRYQEFAAAYPNTVYTTQVLVVIRLRRETLAWRRALGLNTREAYWTYLTRYPAGLYAGDAQRRLHRLAASETPPPGFVPIDLAGVPPPAAGEPHDNGRFAPPPPLLPTHIIGPQPAYLAALPPPATAPGAKLLPTLAALPAVPSVGPPPRRYGPPVGTLAPGGQDGARPYPYGTAAPPVRRFFGTGTPPGAIQPGVVQPGAAQPGVVQPSAIQPGAIPGGPRPQPQWGGTPPPAVHNIPAAPSIAPPPVQQPLTGMPGPVQRFAPPPPPAVVYRPMPPVVQRPPAVIQPPPAGAALPGRKCFVVNGVQRCM